MDTAFFSPSDPDNKFVIETTFSLEKEISGNTAIFIECVADHPDHGVSQSLLNSGGTNRLTKTEQIDFHIAVGLSAAAPTYIFSLGYSFRIDVLF